MAEVPPVTPMVDPRRIIAARFLFEVAPEILDLSTRFTRRIALLETWVAILGRYCKVSMPKELDNDSIREICLKLISCATTLLE